MAPNIHSRLSTDTRGISSLIEDIRRGEIKIPQFQRPFVWNEEQAINLLDSIASHYPIGSLLLWKTSSKLATERNIGDFLLPETDDLTPTDYVLDGQQRLTVIYSCLGASQEDSGFAAAYDLEKEEFIKLPEKFAIHIFPIRWVFNTTKLLDFRTGLRAHAQSEALNKRFDVVYGALTNYQIPVVTLKDLTVEEVCPIFERINSSGTRLSTYDLMVAATWSTSFDLNEEVAEIKDALSTKGFSEIEGDTILKCLAAVQKRSIKREDVVGLRKLDKAGMEALVAQTKSALLKTVDLLSTEFKVYSWDFLPYEAIAIVLCYIFSKSKAALGAEQIRRVRQWFWRSSFDERYRGASEHFISRDLEAIDKFVIEAGGKPSDFGMAPNPNIWETVIFRSNNSRSRAFVLALALCGPRNVTNGVAVDPAEALSIFNQKQFHHLYPRAHLKKVGAPGNHNSMANICILASSENRLISDSDPSIYLPNCANGLGNQAQAVFAANLLPDPTSFAYATAPYKSFSKERATLIATMIEKLCNGETP
jgi:hypothetical protein